MVKGLESRPNRRQEGKRMKFEKAQDRLDRAFFLRESVIDLCVIPVTNHFTVDQSQHRLLKID